MDGFDYYHFEDYIARPLEGCTDPADEYLSDRHRNVLARKAGYLK